MLYMWLINVNNQICHIGRLIKWSYYDLSTVDKNMTLF